MPFILVPKSIPDQTLNEQQLKAIFRRQDKNNDGRLYKRELKAAFEQLGAAIPECRAWRGIAYDVNGDGFISQQELNWLVQYALRFGYTIN